MSEMNFTPDEIAHYYSKRVPKLKQVQANEWRGPCPVHEGQGNSFSVKAKTGEWFCHSKCKFGGGILALEVALTNNDPETCKASILQLIGPADSVEHEMSSDPGPAESA